MMTKQTDHFLRKYLPRGYAAKVQREAGRTYNLRHIYMVRSGQRYTEEIALALVKVAKAEKARRERVRAQLKNI